MKDHLLTFSALRHLSALALAAGLALPLSSQAGSITFATAPLATSTTSTVLPNLMFMLDDSGSMDWDYMPDDVKNFSGNYGFNSSHCNGVYYNPNFTYTPPLKSDGVSYPNASFTNAWRDGYNTATGTDDLNTSFPGGSGSGASGAANYTGPAYYYTYSGTQTSTVQMDFHNTNSIFYKECNSNIGSTTAVDGTNPVNTVFHKTRLATVPTTTLTVTSTSGGATITVSGGGWGSSNTTVTGIKVGTGCPTLGANCVQILNATTSGNNNRNTVAQYIANGINACSAAPVGQCTTSGYTATVSNNVVTVISNGSGNAAGTSPNVSCGSCNMTFSSTTFPTINPTGISGIKVNGFPLMSGSTSNTKSTIQLAQEIASGINATGYSATASGNVVVVTGPTSASNYTPVVSYSPAGDLFVVTDEFPESTPAKLQNFANWYSYYSNRMLMMKTGVGQAFAPINDQYRVGFMTMNNNVNPDYVDIAPFAGGCAVGSGTCQKDKWYTKLYTANPGNSTPLREVLAKVGRLYAHKYGAQTVYTSTITVGGSGSTSVNSIKVNGTELLTGPSSSSSWSSTVARNIVANFIDPSDYTAVANNGVITITGPSSASGYAPVVTDDGGGKTFTVTSFTGTTYTANLNGVTPKDPMQYSCQQNFVILSTDGYWNGNAGYQVDGTTPVGNQDGSVARPQYDGASGITVVTTQYTRNNDSLSSCGSWGSGQKILNIQPQKRTCTTTIANGVAQPESCPSWSNDGSSYTWGTCSTASTVPSPNPSTPQIVSQTTTAGTTGGTSDTLADVAMYYYQSDLRTPALNNCDGSLGTVASTGIDICQNNVFKTATDSNTAQHMTTFTLGLGASGRMHYSPSYQTDSTGDYYSVWKGLTASSTATPPVCAWQANGTTCNWPVPGSGNVENIDDLWHAAVDGGGTYFSATDPSSLASGMSGALAAIASRKGSSAAAATSTLNPVAGNNYAYVASYTTVKWQGNLEARTIDINTGVISQTATWCVESIVAGACPAPGNVLADTSGGSTTYSCVTNGATSTTCTAPGVFDASTNTCKVPMAASCQGTMPGKIASNSDTRTIYTANSTGNALISFGSGTDPVANAAYASANSSNFDAAHIMGLSQWWLLTPTQQAAAQGANLVSFLRGQTGYENRAANLVGAVDNRLFRYRETTMGDALESQPTYIGKPVFSYADPGYSDFASTESTRPGTVYIGANDGMLHAFSALAEGSVPAGTERWAYIPSMVIPNLWKLADFDYANQHTNFVNGSPVISDICRANCTDSASAEWHTILVGGLNAGGKGFYALDITDPTAPTLLWEFTTAKDSDVGYSYGNPVITAKGDGTWVVLLTSGYNNTTGANPGKGFLYVLDAYTGAIINKIGTGEGDATTPSGLAKISAWNDTPSSNRATYVYGGDLLGNVWRFDINSATAFKFATLLDPSGNPQPVTTIPVLGKIGGKRIIYIGTGKYLETSDLSDTQVQTEYAIKDDNATSTFINPAGSPRDSNTLVQQTLTQGNGVRTASNNPVDWTTGDGWYIDFPDAGERSNIESRLVQGTLLVATIVPSNTVCSPGGYGWLNFFDYQSGSSIDTSGIVSASYNNTIVGINVIYINGSPVIETVTANDPTPTINPDVLINGSASGFTGKRVLWRELSPQ